MSKTNHQVPRVLNIASWAMAVVGAFVFSSAVGLVAYNMVQNPISAQTEQTKDDPAASPNDNEIAILNNFPQNPADSAYKGGIIYDKLDDPNGAKWNCLAVPIAGYDKSKNWQENQKIVTEYLQDKLVNGKKIQIFNTYEDFNKAYQAGTLTQADMANTVILSSLDIPAVRDETKDAKTGKKTKCEGTSDPYSLADQGGEKIVPASENNTYQEYLEAQKKQQSEANAQPLPRPAAGTGAEGILKAPVGTGNQENPATNVAPAMTPSSEEPDYNSLLASCIEKVKNTLGSDTESASMWVELKEWLKNTWQVAKIKGTVPNREAQYEKCAKILAGLREKKTGTTAEIPVDKSKTTTAQTKPGQVTIVQAEDYSVAVSAGPWGRDKAGLVRDGWICGLIKDKSGRILKGKRVIVRNGNYNPIELQVGSGKYLFLAAWTDMGIRSDQFDITEKTIGEAIVQYTPTLKWLNGYTDPLSKSYTSADGKSRFVWRDSNFKGYKESPYPNPIYEDQWQMCLKLPLEL